MNFITWQYAYSLYSKATLDESLALYTTRDDEDVFGIRAKYERRGWKSLLRRADTLGYPGILLSADRAVGDEETCIVKVTGNSNVGDRDASVRDASWFLHYSAADWPRIVVA